MLSADVLWRVFVASVAAEAFVVIVDMAGNARGVVITIKQEIFAVIKRRWLPGFGAVAAQAVTLNLLMQGIGRWFVTALTFRKSVFRE